VKKILICSNSDFFKSRIKKKNYIFLKKTNIKTDCDKLEWGNNSLYNSIFDTIFFIFGILLVLEINTKNNYYLIILTILYLTILNFFLFYEYG